MRPSDHGHAAADGVHASLRARTQAWGWYAGAGMRAVLRRVAAAAARHARGGRVPAVCVCVCVSVCVRARMHEAGPIRGLVQMMHVPLVRL